VQLIQIIKCSINYVLQPPFSNEQLLLIALDWQKVLEPVIPEERLQETFDSAVRNHKTTFAINMFDLLNEYGELKKQGLNPMTGRPFK
jgi:hypothetical protein